MGADNPAVSEAGDISAEEDLELNEIESREQYRHDDTYGVDLLAVPRGGEAVVIPYDVPVNPRLALGEEQLLELASNLFERVPGSQPVLTETEADAELRGLLDLMLTLEDDSVG